MVSQCDSVNNVESMGYLHTTNRYRYIIYDSYRQVSPWLWYKNCWEVVFTYQTFGFSVSIHEKKKKTCLNYENLEMLEVQYLSCFIFSVTMEKNLQRLPVICIKWLAFLFIFKVLKIAKKKILRNCTISNLFYKVRNTVHSLLMGVLNLAIPESQKI